VWSVGGMLLTGEIEVLGEKPVSVPFFPLQISYEIATIEAGIPGCQIGY